MSSVDESHHRIVQALSPILLETAVLKLEAGGWRRVGNIALATPVAETKPPYWVQSMSRDPFSPGPAPGRDASA
jgi:hypothetical protein